MKLIDVTEKTQEAFIRCLQEEQTEDHQLVKISRRWYEKNKEKGLRAKLLILDDGRRGGMCQYIPIEHSHLTGKDLMAILCLWVHGYEHGIGIQQGKGYGKRMLDAIEEDARLNGKKGVAAWGMDWDTNWMPATFFEHQGYTRTDEEEKVIVFWKPFSSDANPPRLLRLDNPPPKGTERVNVTVAVNGWCLGCYKFLYAREAVEGIESCVEYTELDPPDRANILHLGKVGGIFLDGEVFQPYQICDKEELRAEIIRLYERKKTKQ